MKKVKFTADAVVLVDGKAEVEFKSGAIEELNDASADRWIRRGVAEEYEGKAKKGSGSAAKSADSAAS